MDATDHKRPTSTKGYAELCVAGSIQRQIIDALAEKGIDLDDRTAMALIGIAGQIALIPSS